MTQASYNALSAPPVLSPCQTRMIGPDGNQLTIQGEFHTCAVFRDVQYPVTILVIATGGVNLLSRQTSEQMGLVQRLHVGSSDAQPKIGCMLGKPVEIELKPDCKPYNCVNARRIPIHIRLKVRTELERMEKAGVITKVEQPTDWCSPLVSVLKPNGNVRVCVDLKRLNASVKRESTTRYRPWTTRSHNSTVLPYSLRWTPRLASGRSHSPRKRRC